VSSSSSPENWYLSDPCCNKKGSHHLYYLDIRLTTFPGDDRGSVADLKKNGLEPLRLREPYRCYWYRDEDGKLKFVYTLNNTALASPRILLPRFEVRQQPDGSVRFPAAVRPYMGGQEYIRLSEKGR
jgi:hypothetical protein